MKRLVLIGAILALSTAMMTQAHATVPGKNGRIAYRRYLNAAQTHAAIFTITPQGTRVRQITHPRRGFVTDEPDWSPNGRWIVYQREKKGEFPIRLFKIRPNGSDRTYLSSGCGRTWCADGYAAWLPGGNRIAFGHEDCGNGPHSMPSVYIMRSDGTHDRRVTHRGVSCATSYRYSDGSPAPAPSGKRLAFARSDKKRDFNQAIFTVRLDGTGLKRLTPWRIDADQPDWSPNGRWIAFRTQSSSDTKGNIAARPPRRHSVPPHHARAREIQVALVLLFPERQEDPGGTGTWARQSGQRRYLRDEP